jgi:predicted ferric reductase
VLLAVGAASAGLHHALVIGGYSQSPLLTGFWIVLGVIAMGSLAYAWLVRPLLLARAPYRVVANRRLGPEVCELHLAPVHGRAIQYRAGQFVWVSFGRRALTVLDHPYSLASSPLEGEVLKLMIKARGDFSAKAGDIAVGTLAHVDGPHGGFVLAGRTAGSVALFAGGIGIAPILGILRDLELSGDRRPVRLVYGARNASRLVGRDLIEAAASTLALRVEYLLEEAGSDWQGGRGGLTAEVFARTLAGWDARDCLCLLCGPTGMMLAGECELLALGVPLANIVYERFEYD